MRAPPRLAHGYPSYREKPPNLVGGALCLDFVNTEEWRGAPERAERLTDYCELLAWAEAAGAIGRRARAHVAALAAARPAEAETALAEARLLRATLGALFAAGPGDPPLLARFNR